MSSGISIGAMPKTMTLTSLDQAFSTADQNQHLRFSDAKGLHTHGSREFSVVDILAKFRNSSALTERAQLRQDAVGHVKQAIDNQYGKGMGDRVFASLTGKNEIGTGGVTKRELQALGREAERIMDADVALAENKAGKTIGSILSTTVNTYGNVLTDVDGDRQPQLRHAMAEAINKLPAGATTAQMERAAQGAVLLDHILTKAAGHTHTDGTKGYNRVVTQDIAKIVEQATTPSKPADSDQIKYLSTAPLGSVLKYLDQMATAALIPNARDLGKAVALDQLISRPIAERAGILSDFLKNETAQALKGSGGAESFIRGTEDGAHYDVLKHQVDGHFTPKLQTVKSELAKFGKIEYRQGKLESLTNPDGSKLSGDQIRQKVQDFADAFDAGMTVLFGGTSTQEIADNVATLPQEFCDLLRTAKSALPKAEAAIIREQQATLARGEELPLFGDAPTLSDAERAALPREREVKAGDVAALKLDSKAATVPALRGWNPLLAMQATFMKDANFTPFAKINQNVANGIDPSTVAKESPPANAVDILQATFTKWQAANTAWLAAAAARGRDFS